MKTTAVKGKRGRLVHTTMNLRMALCGIKVDGFIVMPDDEVTCQRCLTLAAEFAQESGFN